MQCYVQVFKLTLSKLRSIKATSATQDDLAQQRTKQNVLFNSSDTQSSLLAVFKTAQKAN